LFHQSTTSAPTNAPPSATTAPTKVPPANPTFEPDAAFFEVAAAPDEVEDPDEDLEPGVVDEGLEPVLVAALLLLAKVAHSVC